MKVEVTTITPEMAKAMLRNNDRNRHLRYRLVDRYARDMAAGSWFLNGSAIVMNGRTLIDGQHRLEACVKAGVPFQTILATGAKQEAMNTIDSGAKRTMSDVLNLQGYAQPSMVAAVARQSLRWDTGRISRREFAMESNTEILAWVEKNPEVAAGVEVASITRHVPLRAPTTAVGSAAAKATKHGMGDEFSEFTDQLVTGEGLTREDAAFHLRSWLINQAASAHRGRRPNADVVLAYIVKAWNAYIVGEPLLGLSYKTARRRDSGRRESFPVMVNASGAAISYEDPDDDK
jgi:hypothetical protein